MKDFEKLKDNEAHRIFADMSNDEQQCLRKLRPKGAVQFLQDTMKWEVTGKSDTTLLYDTSIYRIDPDYQLELSTVDLEIVQASGDGTDSDFLGVYKAGNDFLSFHFTHLYCLPSLEEFDDFWYQDSPGCKFFGIKETAIARCRFEGKKVFARFRI